MEQIQLLYLKITKNMFDDFGHKIVPIKTIVDIIQELIRLTKSGSVTWNIKSPFDKPDEDWEWYSRTPFEYRTTLNGINYKMFTATLYRSPNNGTFWIDDMKVLDIELDRNPEQHHNYLNSLNCNPFTQLQSVIEGKPNIDIVNFDSILNDLKNT